MHMQEYSSENPTRSTAKGTLPKKLTLGYSLVGSLRAWPGDIRDNTALAIAGVATIGLKYCIPEICRPTPNCI